MKPIMKVKYPNIVASLKDWRDTFEDHEDLSILEKITKKLEKNEVLSIKENKELEFHLWQIRYDINNK